MHINFGEAPKGKCEEIDQAAEVFWRMITGGELKQFESVCRRQGRLPR